MTDSDDPFAALDDAEDDVDDFDFDAGSKEPQRHSDATPDRVFPTVVEFVEEFLVEVVNRKFSPTPGSGLRWDPNWHAYPEVVCRLIALHEAYEEANVSPSGKALSEWWIYHFDAHMRVILDGETGPFHRYNPDEVSTAPPRLEVTDARESPLLRDLLGWEGE